MVGMTVIYFRAFLTLAQAGVLHAIYIGKFAAVIYGDRSESICEFLCTHTAFKTIERTNYAGRGTVAHLDNEFLRDRRSVSTSRAGFSRTAFAFFVVVYTVSISQ